MDIFLYIIVFIVVMIMFLLVIVENKKSEKKMDENKFTVRQPKIFLFVGILGTLFGCSILILMSTVMSNDTATWWVYAFFLSYTIFTLFLFVYCISWKLKVEDDQITYIPFIGIKKVFKVSDITRIKMRYGELKAYTEKKKLFAVGSMANGYRLLAARLKKEQQINFDF